MPSSARKKKVTAAQTLVNFDQELVCCITLFWRRNKIPGRIIQVRLREEIEYRGAGGVHRDRDWFSVAVGKVAGSLGKRRHVGNAFFFNDTATTEIYTLSLHDALPI